MTGCNPRNSDSKSQSVYLQNSNGKFQLIKDGNPYYIKGVSGHEHMDKVKAYGGNSIRTYDYTALDSIMEMADFLGLTVMVGLEVGKEYWGNDFNYFSIRAIHDKIDEVETVVRKYKDHPALLMWSVGNEVHLHGGNRFMIFYTLNRIAKMIHEVDGNHPVMTTLPAGENIDKYGYISFVMPHIDILGFNSFGSISTIKSNITKRFGWNKPYILSEWGSLGPWEVNFTEWGSPVEIKNSQKVEKINEHWDIMNMDQNLLLGGYVFYWGNKYEVTDTWFSFFSEEGYESNLVKALQAKWTGELPSNLAPFIDTLFIESTLPDNNNRYLVSDSLYAATVRAFDPENDSLTYRWELRPEGINLRIKGEFKNNLTHLFENESGNKLTFKTPSEEGGYRLISYVYDGRNHVASHNIPFYVIKK